VPILNTPDAHHLPLIRTWYDDGIRIGTVDKTRVKMTSNSLNTMQGKTVVITGATNGIGKAAALALGAAGAQVIVVGRSREKAEAVAATIHARGGSAEIALADLSLVGQVRRLAAELRDRFSRIDVLVNNAGAIFNTRQVTEEGFEMTFALNHLSYFVLTTELLPVLIASAPARVVSVSSGAHWGGKLDFENLQGARGYSGFTMYAHSKLMNIAFTTELARRMAAQGAQVTANAMHPGFVGTGFATNNGGLMKLGMQMLRPFILSPEQGADTLVWLASAPEMEGKTGGYYEKRKPAPLSPAARDADAARRLWEVSEALAARVLV
jgi:NAD(P)-dependent dehydrogenase (short-subunit alcohol dehydrogenase family)